MKIDTAAAYLSIMHWRCRGYWNRGAGLELPVQDCTNPNGCTSGLSVLPTANPNQYLIIQKSYR